MSQESNASMALAEGWRIGPRHRNFSVKKIENGFLLDAEYLREDKNHRGEKVWTREQRQFVAVGRVELFGLITAYLELPASELREEVDSK